MEALSCPHFVDNSRWDEETLSWWYSATDIIQTLGTVELVELCINAMCLHSVLSI